MQQQYCFHEPSIHYGVLAAQENDTVAAERMALIGLSPVKWLDRKWVVWRSEV